MLNNEDLLYAIYTHIDNIAGIPTVIFPNDNTTVIDGNHIRVNVIPATPDEYGLNSIAIYRGIIQLSVYVGQGVGEIEASRICDTIAASLTKNTQMTYLTTSIRVSTSPNIGQGMPDGSYFMKPISVSYQKVC